MTIRLISTAAAGLAALLVAAAAQAAPLSYTLSPLYTSVDDPANHTVAPGTGLDGVARLVINNNAGAVGCTGSLLSTGRHLLTAAHCLTDGGGAVIATGGTATFNGPGGPTSIGFAQAGVTVHSGWQGNLFQGNDIAVIELDSAAPATAERYDIDRGRGPRAQVPKRRSARQGQGTPREVGMAGDKAGYGLIGTGATGAQPGTFGTLHAGRNEYDSFADIMLMAFGLRPGADFVPGSVFLYDFDDGTAAHDALGVYFGIDGLGLGLDEAMSAPGDSGGPTFIDGVIAGITSYGLTLAFSDGSTADVDGLLNSSFGELAGDTRVSLYADFIDAALGLSGLDNSLAAGAYAGLQDGGTTPTGLQITGLDAGGPSVPEPGTALLFGLGLTGLGVLRRRRS